MTNLLKSLTQLIQKSLVEEPPPPEILYEIRARVIDLMAVSEDRSGNGISIWLSKLHDITHDIRLHETLLVRAF